MGSIHIKELQKLSCTQNYDSGLSSRINHLVTGTTGPQLVEIIELMRDIRNNTRYKSVKISILSFRFYKNKIKEY